MNFLHADSLRQVAHLASSETAKTLPAHGDQSLGLGRQLNIAMVDLPSTEKSVPSLGLGNVDRPRKSVAQVHGTMRELCTINSTVPSPKNLVLGFLIGTVIGGVFVLRIL